VSRWFRICAVLWHRAKSEHSAPHEIGWSIAVGVFSGCTPLLGFHMWIALVLATILRLNRLWSLVGSRISFTPLFAVITFCEIESAHRLRTGVWAPLSPHEALSHGKELLGDWLLGTAIVGSALATALGLAGYVVARRWQISHRTPLVPLPPSSESPPSAPPALTP
jgi:uncharacterized protein (DUF2062 family)